MTVRNVNLTADLAPFADGQDDMAADGKTIDAIRSIIEESRLAVANGDYSTIASPEDRDALLARLTRGDAAES